MTVSLAGNIHDLFVIRRKQESSFCFDVFYTPEKTRIFYFDVFYTPEKTRILHAIALLRDSGKLHLWSTTYSHLLKDGKLDLDSAITNVQQLHYLKDLFASGSATNITALRYVSH